MKTKLYILIAVFFMSLGVNAQIDRSQQPKPGPAPKISLEKPQEFELKKLEFEQELKKLYLDDKKDARSLYKVDSSLQKVFAITFLGLYIVLSFVVLIGLYLISIKGLKLDNYVVSFVSTLHGGMSMKVGTIVDFLFGSSQQ